VQTLAHGVDIVKVTRIAEMLRDHGDKFLTRCFTPGEAGYAMSMTRRKAEHLAARFAAKEATMKALGTGLAQGVTWQDVEVVREPSGAPRLVLHGRAAEVAAAMGCREWLISLSHTEDAAIASVIGVGGG
jgi:holo-[acyl-carrier protein] synthase